MSEIAKVATKVATVRSFSDMFEAHWRVIVDITSVEAHSTVDRTWARGAEVVEVPRSFTADEVMEVVAAAKAKIAEIVARR